MRATNEFYSVGWWLKIQGRYQVIAICNASIGVRLLCDNCVADKESIEGNEKADKISKL